MPDVGMFTATEPVEKDVPVIIRYTVEVGGLSVYSESYDVDRLGAELLQNEERVLTLWSRRLKCAVEARDRPGFSAALTRCLADGQCCDLGKANCKMLDKAGDESA